jgi:hypothetical protein
VAGHITVAGGFIDSSEYSGSVEIRIDPVYEPGKSCLTVQTQPAALDLAEKRAFQERLLRLLTEVGRLRPGAYRLMPARRHAAARIHLFSELRRNGRDMLQSFCLRHGAVVMPQRQAEGPGLTRPRFCYRQRLMVKAASPQAARVQAASALPDKELWSAFDLRQFKLECADHENYTFAVEIAFNAVDEKHARKMIVDLFGPLANPYHLVLSCRSERERAAELNGKARLRGRRR